ncbi:uncharacterized protein [Anser cygnoides]|uniref:uncharacterized protein isoform X2 n=1 Tax=Anser cygnoides TaxID=8845 RepID=UPI0034D37AE0
MGPPPSAPAPLGPGPPRARGPSRAAARGAAAAVCWVPPLQFQNSGKSCQVTLTGASSCKTRRKESLPRRRLASLVSVLTETEAKPRCCCSLLSTAGTKNPRPRACHTSTRKSPSLCLQPCSARRTLRTSATRQEDKALLLPLRWQLLPSSCGFTLAVQPPLISRARAIGTSATAIPTRGFYLLQRSLASHHTPVLLATQCFVLASLILLPKTSQHYLLRIKFYIDKACTGSGTGRRDDPELVRGEEEQDSNLQNMCTLQEEQQRGQKRSQAA